MGSVLGETSREAHCAAVRERGIHCDGSLKGSINTKLHHTKLKTKNIRKLASLFHIKLNNFKYPQLVRENCHWPIKKKKKGENLRFNFQKKQQFGCDNLYCKIFSIYVLQQQSNVHKNAQHYWWKLHWDIKWPAIRDKEADFCCWSYSWIWLVKFTVHWWNIHVFNVATL